MKQGAEKDKGNNDRITPLFIAARNGHFAAVRHLVQKGGDKKKARGKFRDSSFVAARNDQTDSS